MNRHVYAVLATAALAGCGTGGGGSGGPSDPVSPPSSSPPSNSPPESSPPESSPPASSFPTLSTVREVRASSAMTSRSHEHFRDRVSASADGAGNVTFRVNDPNVGVYSFTVRLLPNTSISSSGEKPDFAFSSLDYSSAGVWAHHGFAGTVPTGAGAVGVATGRADLPTTGTATYSGAFIGRQVDIDGERALVEANASSTANFATGAVSFDTTNSRTRGGVADPTLDLVGTMTFQSSGGVRQNALRGTVSTKGEQPRMTGEIRANFFGPASSTSAPPELGGSVAVRSTSPGIPRSMIGGFVMKR
jgi:hypothetical protein